MRFKGMLAGVAALFFAVGPIGAEVPGFSQLEVSSSVSEHSVEPNNSLEVGVARFSLSEHFINSCFKKLCDKKALKQIKVSFVPNSNAMRAEGTIAIQNERVQLTTHGFADGFSFDTTFKTKVSPDGHLSFAFDREATKVWFYRKGEKPDESEKLIPPKGSLQLGMTIFRRFFAAMFGDFTEFDALIAKFEKAKSECELAAKSQSGEACFETQLEARKYGLRIETLKLQKEKLIRRANKNEKLLQFLGKRQFKPADAVSVDRNELRVKLELERLFPFLSDIQLGRVLFTEDEKTKTRYMTIEVDAHLAVQG